MRIEVTEKKGVRYFSLLATTKEDIETIKRLDKLDPHRKGILFPEKRIYENKVLSGLVYSLGNLEEFRKGIDSFARIQNSYERHR